MGLKKIISLILLSALMMCFFVPAMADSTVPSFGRISVLMPEIKVEIKGSGYAKDSISAMLDNEKLTVNDVNKYSQSNTSCAYLLVDLSTSMRRSFDSVKNNIVSYINGLSQNNKVVLLTFGENSVDTVLTGAESREEAIEIVNNLKCNEKGTMFYEALNSAYQMSTSTNNNYDREYVIAFSDGIDIQKGNSTFDEVKKLYNSHNLPLYAACSNNASKDAADKFGELARSSGGAFSIIDNEEKFDRLLNEINDVTIVDLSSSSNFADGKEKQLSVKVGDNQIECNIPITRSISDNFAPTVTKLVYDIKKDEFIISFSEKVTGADIINSYKILNSKGEKIEISDIFYSEEDNSYEIKTKSPIYKDTYIFEFSGIKDTSKEANSLTGKMTVTVKEAKSKPCLPIWAIILIVSGGVLLVGITVVIILVVSKKKKDVNQDTADLPSGNVSEVDYTDDDAVIKHHIKTNSSVRLRLHIKTGKTSEQDIETNIVSSLIVGRSNTSDIYIDDTKLSRQHFAIENDNGTLYIIDLQSRNGTLLNGTRINTRRRIDSGDKIAAGLSDIVITILGR